MAIGAFGKCVFSTSDKRILTPKGLSYRTSARTVEHDVLSGKPKTEYIGSELSELSFSMVLRADLGISVQKELELWRKMTARGTVARLVIGKKPLGTGRWMVASCSEAWNVVTNKGVILSATLEVTLREYL